MLKAMMIDQFSSFNAIHLIEEISLKNSVLKQKDILYFRHLKFVKGLMGICGSEEYCILAVMVPNFL